MIKSLGMGFVSTTFQRQPELEIIGRVSDGLEAVEKTHGID